MNNLNRRCRKALCVAALLACSVVTWSSSAQAQQTKSAAPDRSPLRPLTESLKTAGIGAGAGLRPLGEGPTTNQAAPGIDVEQMLSPGGLSSTLKIMLLLTVISLAPSILIMTTCFIRFVIV